MGINSKLLPDLFYSPGDNFEMFYGNDTCILSGYVSNAKKLLSFTVPCDKSLKNISSISADVLQANVRGANNYLFANGYLSGGYNLLSNISSITCIKITNNLIGVAINYTDAIPNSVNNSTISISLSDFKFILN